MPFTMPRRLISNRTGLGRTLVLISLFIGATPTVTAKEYYKWVDEKGISHFSEKPVPGKNAVKMGGSTKTEEPTTPETSAAQAPINNDASGTASSAANSKPGNSLNDAAASNEQVCTSARSRLSALQSGQRIKMVGDDGKSVYLETKQIEDEIAKTQALIKASCL